MNTETKQKSTVQIVAEYSLSASVVLAFLSLFRSEGKISILEAIAGLPKLAASIGSIDFNALLTALLHNPLAICLLAFAASIGSLFASNDRAARKKIGYQLRKELNKIKVVVEEQSKKVDVIQELAGRHRNSLGVEGARKLRRCERLVSDGENLVLEVEALINRKSHRSLAEGKELIASYLTTEFQKISGEASEANRYFHDISELISNTSRQLIRAGVRMDEAFQTLKLIANVASPSFLKAA